MSTEKSPQSDKQKPKPDSPTKTGDQIHAQIGDDVRGAAVGKNIILVIIENLDIPHRAVALILVAVVIITASVVIIGSDDFARLLPKPLPVQPAEADETLILIATFHNTAVNNSEAHNKIKRAIEEDLDELDEADTRVAVEPTILTADQQANAKTLGERYNAAMVIWGEDTGVEVIANFLNLRQPGFNIATAKIHETERSQLANPSAYAKFITADLPNQVTFLSLYTLGQLALYGEEHKLAIRRIETAIDALTPNMEIEGIASAYFVLGWIYQADGNYNAAIANYDQAIALEPKDAMIYNNRGLAHDYQGDQDAAVSDYDQAIILNSEDVLAFLNRALVYIDQGDLDAAIRDYDQAIAFNPGFADAYSRRGAAYALQGNLDAAIRDYDQAIVLNPNDAATYHARGNALADQGNLGIAIQDYNQAVKIDSEYADAYYDRGNAHYDKGDLKAAIRDFDQTIALQPYYTVAFNNRGLAHYDDGDLDSALRDFDQVIALNPDNAGAYNNRGIIRSDHGDLNAAIRDYDQAIILNPDDAATFNNRGNARFDQGDLIAAIRDYDQAIALNPDNAAAFYNRGLARADQGDLDAAISDYDQAIALFPDSVEIHNSLCWIHLFNQQANLAFDHCEQAIELHSHPWYVDGRGLANALLGNYESAIADFQVVVDWIEKENNTDFLKHLEKRKAWIAALEKGENPFTPEVLEELRTE